MCACALLDVSRHFVCAPGAPLSSKRLALSGDHYMQPSTRTGVRAFAVTLSLTLLVWAFAPTPCRAQQNTASLRGTVKDPSGAIIPKAAVKLASVDTGIGQTRETLSMSEATTTVGVMPHGRGILRM